MAKNNEIRYTSAARTLSDGQMKRAQKMLVEIALQTQALTKKDLGDWRNAMQMAVNVDNPVRRFLYDIYDDVDLDLHVTGCVSQRQGFVKRKAFRLVNASGKEDIKVSELFETRWFKELMEYALDSRYYGHSLIELGNVVQVEGRMCYDSVKLVPRRHVVPEFGVILRNQTDLWQSGCDYRHSDMSAWLIEVGDPFQLGLYSKIAHQSIPKKNMMSFWDQFGEIFGMPIRVGKTTSQDAKVQDQVEKMLANMGAAAYGLFPEGTEIEIKESQKGDAFNVYDRRIERANFEMSKAILGQTMTIDNGASLSQGQVHYEVFKNIIDEDADYLRDMVNWQLLPKMVKHGFPVQGYRFEWDESIEFSPAEQREMERLVLDNYEVDPQYFIDKYNIPVIKKKEKTAVQLVKPFFD